MADFPSVADKFTKIELVQSHNQRTLPVRLKNQEGRTNEDWLCQSHVLPHCAHL